MATEATPTTETSSTDLSNLSEKEMSNWRLTGDLPEPKTETPPKDSKTAPADSSAAAKTAVTEPPAKAAETPAESVTAVTEPPPPEKNAGTRVKELLSERKQLLAKIEDLEKRPLPAAPAKKDDAPAKPQRADVDEKGTLKYATEEAYEEARDNYIYERASQETRKQLAKEAEEQRNTERQRLVADKWLNGMQLARTKYADLDTVLKTDEKGLVQHEEIKGLKSGSILDGWLVDSEVPFDLLYHFAKTPGEVAKIQAMTPFNATRYLTKLEDKLSVPPPVTPKVEDGSPTVPKPNPRVPAPPTSISGKATAPTDEIARAVAAGDTAAYFKAANDEDLQKAKKRA